MTDFTTKHASDCAVHNGPALPPGPCDCGADLNTLPTLLRSQEARDAAPCVPVNVTGWMLTRAGRLVQITHGLSDGLYRETGIYQTGYGRIETGYQRQPGDGTRHEEDCIWSGDLPALLSALVAERDRLRSQVDLAREKLDHIERHDYDHKLSGTMNLALVQCTAIDALQALKEQQP